MFFGKYIEPLYAGLLPLFQSFRVELIQASTAALRRELTASFLLRSENPGTVRCI